MREAANRGAENFRFFADRAEGARDGLALPSETQLNYTIRQPIGPVGVITPWNTPFMLSTWKMAPALAAGCTVVHKPAEWSPLTALRLAELIHEAGVPAGVVNLVNGLGETAGKALTEHPAIKAIGFVGESITGSMIMRQGAATLKRVHFELGGKNPTIVFADADLDRALDAAIFMIYSLNGERCTSGSRLFVERAIYDEFTARLAERVRRIRVGDPFDPATEVGPLIHPSHIEKVASYVAIGVAEGATLAVGGERPAGRDSGNFFAPTLFTGAHNGMRIAQEEVFGPFLTAIPFDGDEEALRLANDVKYGLAAYLWTGDVTRAHRIAQGVEAGMVWVNTHNVRHLPTPFGGVKSSGIGRDGGDYSFDFYMETKNICIALGRDPRPEARRVSAEGECAEMARGGGRCRSIRPIRARPSMSCAAATAELGVTDLARAREFYVGALGLLETEQVRRQPLPARDRGAPAPLADPDRRRRADLPLPRLQGRRARTISIGPRRSSGGAGYPTEWVERHGQGRTLRVRDPFGVPLEFCFAMDAGRADLAAIRALHRRAHHADRSLQLLRGRFAGDLRLLCPRARFPADRVHRDRGRTARSSGRSGSTARGMSTTSP